MRQSSAKKKSAFSKQRQKTFKLKLTLYVMYVYIMLKLGAFLPIGLSQ